MNIDKAWFVARLQKKELSQRKLAKVLGIDASAVTMLLNGRREMKINEAVAIANILNVPLEEIIRHIGIAPPK